jgi:hypothetical protein
MMGQKTLPESTAFKRRQWPKGDILPAPSFTDRNRGSLLVCHVAATETVL